MNLLNQYIYVLFEVKMVLEKEEKETRKNKRA